MCIHIPLSGIDDVVWLTVVVLRIIFVHTVTLCCVYFLQHVKTTYLPLSRRPSECVYNYTTRFKMIII